MKDQFKFVNAKCTRQQLKDLYKLYDKKEKYTTIKFKNDCINQDKEPAEGFLRFELLPNESTKVAKAIKNNKGVSILFMPVIQSDDLKDKIKNLLDTIVE